MSKLGIIIKREYLSRVKKRTFILTTLGIPLLFVAFSVFMGYLANSTKEKVKIAVVDESGVFEQKLWDSSKHNSITYFKIEQLAALKEEYVKKEYTCLLHITKFTNVPDTSNVKVYSESSLSLDATDYLKERMNAVYQQKVMEQAGMSKVAIDSFNNLSVSFKNIPKDKKETSANSASAIGYISGFLIYIIMFIYGSMVMRSVMEEKTNRIAEVIISSVKPFELMMGKVVGVALVGLTQFLLWVVLMGILGTVAIKFFGADASALAQNPMMSGNPQITQAMQQAAANPTKMQAAMSAFAKINWFQIIGCFVLFFLGGYFLYASLFAAVGSMVNEDVQEAQQLTLPITMPIILGFFISMQASRDPNSGLAIFGSMFPLTSPLVMMSRIPYGIPTWQIVLSLLILVATFIGTTWIAAKIYRTGILMYGKKLTWKDAFKWITKG